MRNLLLLLFSLFFIGIIAYVISYIIILGNTVNGIIDQLSNSESHSIILDPKSFSTWMLTVFISFITFLIIVMIGISIRRVGIEK